MKGENYMCEIDFEAYEYYMKNRPHVVILGAGASCAAIPNGDKNGKKISAMSGFIDKLGLSDIISTISIKTKSDNLEDVYMELDERSKNETACDSVKIRLEQSIREYMSSFILPDEPTIYDFLIMSLTSKDLIATFNWDPFLIQAIERIQKYTCNIPQIAFLHGNVAAGYCQDDKTVGDIRKTCKCGKELKPIKLLFPIKKKDYSSDPVIKKSWEQLKDALKCAYMVTIFGYSAPSSDTEAVAMLKQAWGDLKDRKLEEIELVDIREEDDVITSWKHFIHTHHYSYHKNYFNTTLARCPRRTCEATFDRLMNCIWLDGSNGFKEGMSFSDLDKKTRRLIFEEEEKRCNREMLSNPYH